MKNGLFLTFSLIAILLLTGSNSAPTQIERIEKKVTVHLKSYFKTHGVVGAPAPKGYSLVTVDTTTTEEVSGWGGRYRTTGKATVESQGSAFSADFEVISQVDEKQVIRIIDTKAEPAR